MKKKKSPETHKQPQKPESTDQLNRLQNPCCELGDPGNESHNLITANTIENSAHISTLALIIESVSGHSS